jgi:hypothetical protein
MEMDDLIIAVVGRLTALILLCEGSPVRLLGRPSARQNQRPIPVAPSLQLAAAVCCFTNQGRLFLWRL